MSHKFQSLILLEKKTSGLQPILKVLGGVVSKNEMIFIWEQQKWWWFPNIWWETVEQRTGLTQVPFHHSMPQSYSTVSWEMEQHCVPINHERSSLLFSQVLQDLSNSSGWGSAHPWQTTAALSYILYIIKNVMSALNKMSKCDKCGQCSKKVGLSSWENCT